MVNTSDSGSSPTQVAVLCPGARHIYPPKVLVIPRKRWLRPSMTEKIVYRDVKNQTKNNLYFIAKVKKIMYSPENPKITI